MILILLPDTGYHPAELSLPSKELIDAGFDVQFVTLSGNIALADPYLVKVKRNPLTCFFTGSVADQLQHCELIKSEAFCNPKAISNVSLTNVQGVLVPGGFGQGMKTFIESVEVGRLLADAFVKNIPVAAIGQAVRVLARVIDPRTGVPVIYDRKTTGLPHWFEHLAWLMTRKSLGDHFKIYPLTTEAEVRTNLHHQRNFLTGSALSLSLFGLAHNSSCVVQDKKYLSARWAADCHQLTTKFIALLKNIPFVESSRNLPQVCLG